MWNSTNYIDLRDLWLCALFMTAVKVLLDVFLKEILVIKYLHLPQMGPLNIYQSFNFRNPKGFTVALIRWTNLKQTFFRPL